MFEPFSPFAPMTKGLVYETIKTNVRGILDSYHSDFDFLIESLQNAVDALEERFASDKPQAEEPRVEIVINYQSRRVRVSDNGVGMDGELARNILAPSFTTKPYYGSTAKRSLRGHKGVGLTFLAFSGDAFRFATKQNGLITFACQMREADLGLRTRTINSQSQRFSSQTSAQNSWKASALARLSSSGSTTSIVCLSTGLGGSKS